MDIIKPLSRLLHHLINLSLHFTMFLGSKTWAKPGRVGPEPYPAMNS